MDDLYNQSVPDLERVIEIDFVRATEAAALTVFRWIGKGDKNAADAAACDAIRGMFDLMDICGEVVIGEGIKDEAPGLFAGEHLGKWRPGTIKFDVALDPIDGTTNVSKGLPNSIAVLCAASPEEGVRRALKHVPSFYSRKIAYGPRVKHYLAQAGAGQVKLENPIEENLAVVARALDKRIQDLTVILLDRPRHEGLVKSIRATGGALRMIGDGDITAAIAPSLPETGIDLYVGIGGSPEGVLASAAIKCLGGDMQMQMWPRDDPERARLIRDGYEDEMRQVFHAQDLAVGKNVIFCATGITDSTLLPGVKLEDHTAITHSILIRAKHGTVRYVKAIHDLRSKTIRLRSDNQEHPL
jgi:fructose-1,6-bisphosphatase II